MKAHVKREASGNQPDLRVILEKNRKFGKGYQAHMIMEGIIDSVLDSEPFTLQEAYQGAVWATEEINKQEGYRYNPREIIAIAEDAMEANKMNDFTSALILKDVKKKAESSDARYAMIDGKEEIMISGRGAVLLAFFGWRDENNQKAKQSVRRYCEHLALHGYGEGATAIFDELEGMNKDVGAEWIKTTYREYVKDDREAISYVMHM